MNGLSNKVVRRVTDGHRNANGCNVPATWFVLEAGTDCDLVRPLGRGAHACHVLMRAMLHSMHSAASQSRACRA